MASPQTQTFSMRIVCLDYYMAPPIPGVDVCYNPFQGQGVGEVPVIRIYGSTLGGQKTCLHVHQAFPYLYVPYENDMPQSIQEGNTYAHCLASAIEKAMKLSSSIGAKRQHVHSCNLVRAKKFYGYHPSEQLFIKIVLYYPQEIARVAALLLGGGILNRVFQPHESHIPYLLQFLIDHNLYGMGHIHLSKLKFRHPLPDSVLKSSRMFRDIASKLRVDGAGIHDSVVLDFDGTYFGPKVVESGQQMPSPYKYPQLLGKHDGSSAMSVAENKPVNSFSELWLRSTVPSDWLWSSAVLDYTEGSPLQGKHPFKRQSTCELEADTTVEEIVNQNQLMYISLSQAGPEVKMVQSLTPIWEEEYSRSGIDIIADKVEDQQPPSEMVLKTLLHGHEFRNALSKLVAEDEEKMDCSRSSLTLPSMTNIISEQNIEGMQAIPNNSNSVQGPLLFRRPMDMDEHLMKFTQAANAKDPSPSPELRISPPSGLLYAADDIGELVAREQSSHVSKALVDEEILRSQMTQSTDLKALDKEAVEVLRWLASSQAIDDLNTEDEEGEELLLSQLLHSSCVEKVLERAHSDLEDASQKECQDILDSIEDVEDYVQGKEGKNVASSNGQAASVFSDHASPAEDMIPQLDGMWDDLAENSRDPSMDKEKKSRKVLEPNSNASDSIPQPTVTLLSGDESIRNQALWGSLPLPSSGGVCKGLAKSDKMSASCDFESNSATGSTMKSDFKHNADVSAISRRDEKFSVKSEKHSLRDLMRKKRVRRPEVFELECHSTPKKINLEEKKIRCLDNLDIQVSEKVYQNLLSIHEDIHGRVSKECLSSNDPGTGASGKALELKKCSEKYGTKVVEDKCSKYGFLPLVKLKTNNYNVEAFGEQLGKNIKRDAANEESFISVDSGSPVVPGEDQHNNEQQQAEADSCNFQGAGMKEFCKVVSGNNLDNNGFEPQEHQELGERDCNEGSGSLPLHPKEIDSCRRTHGNMEISKEPEGKADPLYPEFQIGTIYASDSEDCVAESKSSLGMQFTDISNGIQCSSELDSRSSIWESDYVWKWKQVSPKACDVRECSSDKISAEINVKEAKPDKQGLLSFNSLEDNRKSCDPIENLTAALEGRLDSGSEKLFQVSAEKNLHMPEKVHSPSGTTADLKFCTLSQKDSVEDDLIALAFHKHPPNREEIQRSFGDNSLTPVEHSGVYYGNVKDFPDDPAVMACLDFEVKFREAKYLRPFFMGRMVQRKSVHDRMCYMDKEIWDPSCGSDTVVGIPTHYQNDGSVLYLLTPMQPPPSSPSVVQWLAQFKGESSSSASQQQGTNISPNPQLENNSFKPIPSPDVVVAHSHMTGTENEGLSSSFDSLRLASPKYNETHVLMIGPDNHSQHAELYCKVQQPASMELNGSENPVALDQGSITRPLLKNRQSPDWAAGSSQHESRQCVSKKLQFEDENIPLNDPRGKFQDVKLQKKAAPQEPAKVWREISQISAPSPAGGKSTPLSQTGFRDPASVGAGQQVILMSIEVHAESRGDLRPDPRYDAINFIVVIIQEDTNHAVEVLVLVRDEKADLYSRNIDGVLGCEVFSVKDEKTLFYLFTQLVCLYDPDILMGWETQGGSIGFLAERAAYVGIGLLKNISRTPLSATKLENFQSEDVKMDESKDHLLGELPAETPGLLDAIIEDEWGRTHGSGIYVGGRIVLNLWRIMRGELKLRSYTLEAVAEAVLKRKVPRIPWRTLAWWFLSGPGRARFRCIEYFVDRARLNLAIMDQLDMINRTSELARVFGIDFFSVLSRGSQYRVESMMLRLAHTQNFLLVSPSRQQVASQPAMECLPLVMEPESRFYTDPVVVLDFQSLYPSMIIAYNICFSTCLGKIVPGKTKTLGITSFSLDTSVLSNLEDNLFITPNGIMYVPPEVRRGILPRLLQELLSTRIMVKNVMKKLLPAQRVLQRVLNSRQLALKLISNVTYGYTAAGFSGRMPCAEIADSIVQCGRRTLENAISFVNSHSVWNARVVYGDTDSMFVLLKGRTREEAFRIGQEIASVITAQNPHPVTLKMEKIYHPCVLLTKKRYVGYSYESPTQLKPMFDAKGIETVRRDGCPAVTKILEQSLRILFESRDLSEVKTYLQRQWRKILSGRVSLQDFIFAKEVRLGTYSMKASSLPPAAIVATKAMRVDPRAEPHYGERIPYVVVHGEPGARLVDMVVDPLELLDINTPYRLHDIYYISKQIIPALQRVFGLVGADLKLWYAEMPRPVRPTVAKRRPNWSPSKRKYGIEGCDCKKYQKGHSNKWTIDHYYLSQHCAVCGELIRSSTFVCERCSINQSVVAITMTGRTSRLEKETQHLDAVCRHCGGGDWFIERGIKCISLDCPVFFERRKVQKELLAVSSVSTQAGFYPPCMAEMF